MKRFTDTAKWTDQWFQDLEPKHKLFWLYVTDNCDAAGVWKVNLRLASFQIGESVGKDEIMTAFTGRIEDLGGGYWWVIGFCAFQYRTLNPACAPHRRVIELLKHHGLFNRVNGSSSTVRPKGKATLSLPLRKGKLTLEEEEEVSRERSIQ